jgi:hypothetical protein
MMMPPASASGSVPRIRARSHNGRNFIEILPVHQRLARDFWRTGVYRQPLPTELDRLNSSVRSLSGLKMRGWFVAEHGNTIPAS